MTADVHTASAASHAPSSSAYKASGDGLVSPPSSSSPNPPSFGQRLYGKVKDKALKAIDYEPHVVEVASVTDELRKATSGNVASGAGAYLQRLFPIFGWIWAYNPTWAIADLVAGVTVALVLVPQSMSYAKVATLSPEYGLYASFVGVMVYALFATSKDVTIGPVAVMSLEVARIISHVQDKTDAYTAPEIAICVAFLCGIIVLGIGLLRLGWLIEFIPHPAISGFMTGSALNIAAGQVPSMMGYSNKFDTRAATYKVIINSLKHLPDTKMDAAFGLTALAFLYIVRWSLGRLERSSRSPIIKRMCFFALTLRTAVTIIILTAASYGYLKNKAVADYPISVLKTVPSGFKHIGRPYLPTDLMSKLAPELPVATIILLLEHIAIAKSFGRVNNYKIDPNQELVAIGVANLIGTVFAGYPATGSFSRSAIKAKAGVRTPAAGWVTGAGVVIAIYCLTDAFYWIPNAALSAVIIHAVLDLIASPKQTYGFWKCSPLEFFIFFGAVIVSVFATVEAGIYYSVAASVALLLVRIARPRGAFLGRVRLRPDVDTAASPTVSGSGTPLSSLPTRDVYLPLLPNGVRNPLIQVEAPPPGIIVFRFEESFLYPNASFYADIVLDYAKTHTRPGGDVTEYRKKGDRPWNDPGTPPRLRWRKKKEDEIPGTPTKEQDKPLLRAVVFDMSSSSHIDTTSVQNLVDLKRSLERWAGDQVQFHFATILSPFIKRALLAGGFGTGKGWSGDERPLEIAPVVPAGTEPVLTEHARRHARRHFQRRFPPSPAPATPPNGLKLHGEPRDGKETPDGERRDGAEPSKRDEIHSADLEAALGEVETQGQHIGGHTWGSQVPGFEKQRGGIGTENEAPVVSSLFPRFHLDLTSAVSAAVGRDDW
ncbi:hypothetical protein JCM8097_001812 [Rhodosporidiobolus ruineniae]